MHNMEEASELLSQLQSGELVQKLAAASKKPLRSIQVAELLIEVGVETSLMQKLFGFFDREEFVGDPEDRIDMDNITQSQLFRRLINSCLFQLWEIYQEGDLADFLAKYRGKPFSPPQPKPKVIRSFLELQLEEILKGAEVHQARITAAIEGGYAEAIRVLAAALGCEVDEATVSDFVQSASDPNEVNPNLPAIETASQLIFHAEDQFKPEDFQGFLRGLSDWKIKPETSESPRLQGSREALPTDIPPDDVETTIEETLRTYEALRQVQLAKHEDTTAVDSIIQACRVQQNRSSKEASHTLRNRNDKWRAKCRQGLADIFQFYAKQVRMIGRTPSFAEIERANQVWSISKFLKFLKDFGLSEQQAGIRSLSRVEGSDIFMKFAHLRKALTEESFINALETVAKTFFNDQYDEQNGTHTAGLADDDKLGRLYDLLECDNVARYGKKMKGFGLPFSSDTRCRIPLDDPANRYQFRASQKALEDLDDWRKRNPRRGNLSSNAPKVRRRVQESVDRRSHSKRKIDISLETKNVITWKKLGEMSFDQLKDPDDNFDLRNLIVDSDSDDGVSQKLPALRQMPRGNDRRALASLGDSYFSKARHRLKA